MALIACMTACALGQAQAQAVKYVRYDQGGEISYGILEGETIKELTGDLFDSPTLSGRTVSLNDVKLLAPCVPSKVIAVGLNYKSHIGNQEPSETPPLFAKLPTCIVGPGDNVVLPEDVQMVHYEAEMVIVIGKKAKNVSEADAQDYIFGVTCGNDVSERSWQRSDLQWFRAKATDTFGPIGPAIVSGLDYDNLQLIGRLNGEVVQEQSTKDLFHGTSAIVSFISRYVTLLPGDVIFTGTPGRTQSLSPGDTFEVELEGVGILSNPVVSASDVAQEEESEFANITAAQVIQMMDTNGDGKISKEEAPLQLKTRFGFIDRNRDGVLDLQEAEVVARVMRSTSR